MKPKNLVDMIWNKNGHRMVVTEKKTSQIIYIDGWIFYLKPLGKIRKAWIFVRETVHEAYHTWRL